MSEQITVTKEEAEAFESARVLRDEVLAIFAEAGASEVDVRCIGPNNWIVGASFPFGADGEYPAGKPYWGNTARTGIDPRDMARAHVAAYQADVARRSPVLDLSSAATLEPVRVVGIVNADADGRDEYGNRADSPPTDEGEILYADEQPDDSQYEPPPSYDPAPVEAPEEDLTPGSPSVVIFGDDLPTNRLIRIGQIDEVEAELLTQLQEGWTVEEFASLQNLIQRIGRGEASDDPEARARFNAISERSQQMSRVQSFARDRKAAVRIGDREFVEGFNPESGWPQF